MCVAYCELELCIILSVLRLLSVVRGLAKDGFMPCIKTLRGFAGGY